ncbi:o-succinylbenzoate--CoA ligase [Pontibacillus yanchengensis]|uniref:2-succinylbenzoate--CoA ligase n=1 Tax=Pontibacillus yanchengensis Y32 TaxID=1385514 RepID=A0A0A2TRZ6_9BACI|nr:o-succinylbenzoate--CoA ligase [Pontibacillus yanchengensis]KGP72035.1 O-succinylbenzoic acid--CoA ligase [Pontibacillus yanchengensis Y32]
MSTETIPNWLEKRVALTPERPAIHTQESSITFEELRTQAMSMAGKLTSLGVKKGSHVAIYANNSLDFVRFVHAISYIGAVGVFLNTRLTKREISFQLKDADCDVVIYDQDISSIIEDLGEELAIRSHSFAEISKQNESPYEPQLEVAMDEVYTILYTSGTTGNPKGVMLTYGNHWWSAVSSALNLGLSEEDHWLATLPLFHVGGLSLLFKNVIYGMPITLLTSFDEQEIHNAIMEKGVTIVSVVSVMLKRLLAQLHVDEAYPSSFRCMLLGGGPAPKPLLEEAASKQVPVIQTYGMTETSSQIVTLSAQDALWKIGSAGKPLFPAQLTILNNHQKTGAQTIGEIVVKGPMVTSGYYKRPEANEETIQDGWLFTGDLGYVDEEGFLYVVDRRKDMIISGGENIYPAEIEEVLLGVDSIKEVGVIGQDDDRWGEVPVAFVVLHEGVSLSTEEIYSHCVRALAKYKIPKMIYFEDYLPRNASNKLLRRELGNWLKKRGNAE